MLFKTPTLSLSDCTASVLLTDSRRVVYPDQAVFFAFKGNHHDGHQFLDELYRQGVRQFVVQDGALSLAQEQQLSAWTDASVWVVPSTLRALQQLVAEHRARFALPVLGITGSNGKTIVKEWLAQLLAPDAPLAVSPKSFNSQLGVPLSVWQLNQSHAMGIFEAGISRPHEMEYLQPIIQPTHGIFTNIGSAHDEGFRSQKQKVTEKLRLFTKANFLLYRSDYASVDEEVRLILRSVNPGLKTLTWATQAASDVPVSWQTEATETLLTIRWKDETHSFRTAFRDEASLENLTHCIVFLLYWGLDVEVIRARIAALRPVSMRLELKEGIYQSTLIDDAYNNDLQGLSMALDFLSQQEQQPYKAVVLSDVLQSGQDEAELYDTLADWLVQRKIHQLVGIGPAFVRNAHRFAQLPERSVYVDTATFLRQFPYRKFSRHLVLVKGARSFEFEKIVTRLQQKTHATVLEINLDALVHNLNYYRSKIAKKTKVMAMVKAFAYGSGSVEVASLLQFHRVDYFAVAYADEGVALRQHGITRPIMVMNPTPSSFDTLWHYRLEPELYSKRIWEEWVHFCAHQPTDQTAPAVHIKLDTGMHRLGFDPTDLDWLLEQLREYPALEVATVFSHLVGADDSQHNAYSQQQFRTFVAGATRIEQTLGRSVTKHLLNSAGIVRFPDYQLDMVRVGIGLYGVEASGQEGHRLQPIGRLTTVLSQIKTLEPGQTVGYGRKGQVTKPARIGTIAIGYADGYDRRFGNGLGHVWVNGTLCPTIGNVCMDMTMIDLGEAEAQEGDEVVVFGPELPLTELADRLQTIPYELLTGIGERVKRVFTKE